MTAKDAIEVLQVIKRKELNDNAKINKLCTNPSESIGAKAIDKAIKCIEAVESETKCANDADRDYWKARAGILEQALRKSDDSCCVCVNWGNSTVSCCGDYEADAFVFDETLLTIKEISGHE